MSKINRFSTKRILASILLLSQLVFVQDGPANGETVEFISPRAKVSGTIDGNLLPPKDSDSIIIKDIKVTPENLRICYYDMMHSGIKSKGAMYLLEELLGPITGFELESNETIYDIAKRICINNYSGKEGKIRWERVKEFVKPLRKTLNDECSKVPNRDEIESKWSNPVEDTLTRKLSFDHPEETLCAFNLIVKFIDENDPTKIKETTEPEKKYSK